MSILMGFKINIKKSKCSDNSAAGPAIRLQSLWPITVEINQLSALLNQKNKNYKVKNLVKKKMFHGQRETN